MKADHKEQISLYHPILSDILEWLEDVTGFEFTQTSSYRDGDSGVHGTIPLRGTDLRCPIGSIGVQIEILINNNWQYDTDRPQMACCIYHEVGSGGKHLHIQVHDNTIRRI